MSKTTKKEVKKPAKKISAKPIVDTVLSYVALIILAGLAYQGVVSLVEAKPTIQTAIGIITIVLLVKTALKK